MKKIIMMMLLAVMALTSTATFAQTKKDGTKDMRYKTNKQVLKKDGTPDMRYKANKTETKTTSKKAVAKKTSAPK
jgi:Ni/Co efflux regulator RcnB